jgi:ABC-type uncharacterized transport system fused permease/ATPase subunit
MHVLCAQISSTFHSSPSPTARTIFSVLIAEVLGRNAQFLVSRQWPQMMAGVQKFTLITVPAAAVNSGLNYFTTMLALRFRIRLSAHVHSQYLKGVNFYKAVNLGKKRIDNAYDDGKRRRRRRRQRKKRKERMSLTYCFSNTVINV